MSPMHTPPSSSLTPPPPATPVSGHARDIVLSLLLDGPHSRTDLATRLDLSAGSLTRLTKPLLAAGLIVETPTHDGNVGLGRPSVPLSFTHNSFVFVGIKLTKTHAYGALTRANAQILAQAELPLADQSPAAAISAITRIVEILTAHKTATVPPFAVGVTLGGHVLNYRTVTHADHLGWDQVPLADLVEQATGITCVVENDIVAQTEYTHWFGQGTDTNSFALFTMGAGIGYGLVAHGKAVGSPEAGLSLLSHFPLLSPGLTQYGEQLEEHCPQVPLPVPRHSWALTSTCGHPGCATSMLTLASLESRASAAFGREVSFSQLLGLARAGDPTAVLILDASGYALGTALAAISNLTLVPRIVLGGEASELAQVAHSAMLKGLHGHRDPRTVDPEIRFQHPDLALWAQGAAVVAVHNTLLGRRGGSSGHSQYDPGAQVTV